MLAKINSFVNLFSRKSPDLPTWMIGFLGIIFIRCFIEQFLALCTPLSLTERTIEYWHNFYFFAISLVAIWIFLSLLLKAKPQKLGGFFVFALFFTIAPPLIDMAKTGGEVYWSFYLLSSPKELLSQFLTFFGRLPSGIVYFGTKITFISAIIISAAFIFMRVRDYLKSLVGALGVYLILFLGGSFPTIFFYLHTLLFGSEKISEIKSFHIAQFFMSQAPVLGVGLPSFQYTLAYKLNLIYYVIFIGLLLVLFWKISREKFLAALKNFRLPQLVYHSGLFFIGLGLGILKYPENFRTDIFSLFAVLTLLLSVWLSWKASIVINDLDDFEIDKISNPNRPLPKGIFTREEYSQFGLFCFFLALIGALTVGFSFAVLIVAYQIIAWFYSASPVRLKRFPAIATFISSVASIMVLFLGYILLSDNQEIHTLSPRIIFLLLITYTISLPIKDFKDIEGDKKDSVWTIPVLLGEKKARLFVATGVFISYILSVFLLNELDLFFWAMIFGISTFLVITNEKVKPRELPAWVLGAVSVYAFILIWVAFF